MTEGALNPVQTLYNYKNVNDFNPYPPFTYMLYIPIYKIPFHIASVIFHFVNLFFVFLIIKLYIYNSKLKLTQCLYIWFFALCFPPLWFNIKVGQLNIFIGFIFFLIYYCEKKSYRYKNILISFLIAFGFLVKITPIFLIPYYLVKKKFEIIAYTVGMIILLVLFSLLFIEANEWMVYYNEIFSKYSNSWVVRTINNQGIFPLYLRLFSTNLENTIPIIYFPKLLKFFSLLTNVIILIIFFKGLYFSNKNFKLEFSFSILFTQLMYGSNWIYTYSSLLLALIILFHFTFFEQTKFFNKLIFSIGMFFLYVVFDFSKLNLKYKYELLLTVPLLYGNLILFVLNYFYLKKNVQRLTLAFCSHQAAT